MELLVQRFRSANHIRPSFRGAAKRRARNP